jgi:hypothetical protein
MNAAGMSSRTSTYVQYNNAFDAENVIRGMENDVTLISLAHLMSSYVTGRLLRRTLLDSIGLWTALTSWDVYYNDLTGTIPDTLGQWTALTYCELDGSDPLGCRRK